jgi:hypothetical protein
MEITCSRCHQAIPADGLYCPSCGLPQLVYSSEEGAVPSQVNQWDTVLHEPGAVEWKPALRVALLLAIPAGLIFGTSFLGLLGLVWIAAAAAWVVLLYVRRQRAAKRPVLLTTGAGARIGLVTGLITGWIAFASMGTYLYLERFAFHQGKDFDDFWQTFVAQTSLQWQQASAASQDPQTTGAVFKSLTAWLLSAEGRAGSTIGGLMLIEFMLVGLAVAGGALGAKLMMRTQARN